MTMMSARRTNQTIDVIADSLAVVYERFSLLDQKRVVRVIGVDTYNDVEQ